MHKLPRWVLVAALPFGSCAAATLVTWRLWPYVAPTASPLQNVVPGHQRADGRVAGTVIVVPVAAGATDLPLSPVRHGMT